MLLLPCRPVLLLHAPCLLRPDSSMLVCMRCCWRCRCRHMPLAAATCRLLLHRPVLLLLVLLCSLLLLLLCPGRLLLGMNPGHLLLLWRRSMPKCVHLLRMLLLPPGG